MSQHDDCTDSQDQFCSALGIGQSVKWKQIVQDKKRRDLQNDLTHYRKTQRIFSKPQSLENTYSKEIYAKEKGYRNLKYIIGSTEMSCHGKPILDFAEELL